MEASLSMEESRSMEASLLVETPQPTSSSSQLSKTGALMLPSAVVSQVKSADTSISDIDNLLEDDSDDEISDSPPPRLTPAPPRVVSPPRSTPPAPSPPSRAPSGSKQRPDKKKPPHRRHTLLPLKGNMLDLAVDSARTGTVDSPTAAVTFTEVHRSANSRTQGKR